MCDPIPKMRWVLIRPQNCSPYYDPEIQEPLGIEYLASLIESSGGLVLILDSSLDRLTDARLARRAASFEPDVIGFSITTAQEIQSVLTIYAEIKKLSGDKSVLWLAGGNFISTELDAADKMLPSDFLLAQFEGETLVQSLLNDWTGPKNPGVKPDPSRIYRGHAVHDLDTLPFPKRPYAEQILGSGWAFNLQGSRGCCGACMFCSSPGMSLNSSNRWRGRSIKNIVDEIENLNRNMGARSFNFIDEDFLGNNHHSTIRAREFSDEICQRQLQISFGIQVRPDSLNEEIIHLLARAGLTYVFMGLESDDPADLRRWHRPYTQNPWPLVNEIRKKGAEIHVGVMMFHSHATLEGIKRFALKLKEFHLLEYRSARNRMDAMPGSQYYIDGVNSGQYHSSNPGPQPIPYIHSEIDSFHRDLLDAINPLAAPSMQAVCALPPLLAKRRFDDRFAPSLLKLKDILSYLDHEVARSFFEVLSMHESGNASHAAINPIRNDNYHKAIQGARMLVSGGFFHSLEELVAAIKMESGELTSLR